MRRRSLTYLPAALGVLAAAAPAGAQGSLTVRTLEHGAWGASIAALQTDLESQGTTLSVVVEDASGARSACGSYQLVVDDAGSRAFDLVGCDAASGATELVLVDRMALFEHGAVVARPRRIGVAAIELRHGTAAGGAQLTAETELRCSLAVRPYLVDLSNGARVPATPDRFELRPVGEGVTVQPLSDGWTVRAGLVRIEYEIVERASGDVVLRETVSLQCGAPARTASQAGALEVIELVPGRVFRGATMTRSLRDDQGSCGGEEGPEQWYVVRLAAAARLSLRLVSEFDAALYVREGAIDGPEIACRDRYAMLETLEMNLEAGVYYVAVDGTGTHGRYRLVSFEDAPDPRALASAPHAEIANHESLDGELVPARSGYAASCGGDQAPEHVYWFRLDRPSFVSLRLASRFDAALYLLEASGAELHCRSAMGLPHDTRRSRIAAELGPGLYYVVVDGESAASRPGRYRLALHQLPLR